MMHRWIGAAVVASSLGVLPHPQGAGGALSAAVQQIEPLEVRLWFDRGEEPLLDRGDRVRVYYRLSSSAFVAIFQIDTDGLVRMVYPRSPADNYYVHGNRDYRLVYPRSSTWYVEDQPGVGYFFAVASPTPFDFSSFEYSYGESRWDLTTVGYQVYSDPFVAMDEYVAELIPDWEVAEYALDFTTYHVGQRHDYPRFLCYDCHGYRPYYSWNPYLYTCSSFRIVIYNDPYYYPLYRYHGSRVVYPRPLAPGQPRFVFKERAVGEAGSPLVQERGRLEVPGVAGEVPRRSASPLRSGSGQDASSRVPVVRWPGTDGRDVTRGGEPTGLPRVTPLGGGTRDPGATPPSRLRPSDAARARPQPATGAARPGPVRPSDPQRPSLERRPKTGGTQRPPGGSAVTRPSTSGGASARPSRSGGTTGSVARPSTSGGASARPSRSGGSTGSATRPSRPGGASARPSRSGGNTGSVARPAGGPGNGRPPPSRPARRPGGLAFGGPSANAAADGPGVASAGLGATTGSADMVAWMAGAVWTGVPVPAPVLVEPVWPFAILSPRGQTVTPVGMNPPAI